MVLYDFPLTSWIGASLRKKELELLVDAIRRGKSIDDIIQGANSVEYLDRLVKEEVTKQFSSPNRPVVELVLNAVDARPLSAERYDVRVRANGKKVRIVDEGVSMELEEILRLLIIPFSTEKEEERSRYIGRFGIGFYSAFNYCIQNPRKGRITARTSKNNEGYEVCFYATTNCPSSLRMALKRSRAGKKGTTITITKSFDTYSLKGYVQKEVRNIPTFNARIFFNKKALNYDGNEWYFSTLRLSDQREVEADQRIALQDTGTNHVYLTSLGVTVKDFETTSKMGLKVLFPPLVNLVIGRDEFVRDHNYFACARESFVPLEKLIRHYLVALRREDLRADFIELVPSLFGAVGLSRINEIPNLEAIKKILLPAKRYALLDREYALILPFAGSDITSKVFVASHQSCNFWWQIYRTFQGLAEDDFGPEQPVELNKFVHRLSSNGSPYPNIRLLFREVGSGKFRNPQIDYVRAVSIQEGKSPFMYDEGDKTLYLNQNHHLVNGGFNSLKANYLISRYLQLPHIQKQFPEADYIEREMFRLSADMGRYHE